MIDILTETASEPLRAAICGWMAEKGYAIGNGDTIKELLEDINRQAMERGFKLDILDRPISSIPTRGEWSRELAVTPCCGASWVRPKTAKPTDRYAVCSECGEHSISWEVIAAPIKVTKGTTR